MWDSRPRLSKHRLKTCAANTFHALRVGRQAHEELLGKI